MDGSQNTVDVAFKLAEVLSENGISVPAGLRKILSKAVAWGGKSQKAKRYLSRAYAEAFKCSSPKSRIVSALILPEIVEAVAGDRRSMIALGRYACTLAVDGEFAVRVVMASNFSRVMHGLALSGEQECFVAAYGKLLRDEKEDVKAFALLNVDTCILALRRCLPNADEEKQLFGIVSNILECLSEYGDDEKTAIVLRELSASLKGSSDLPTQRFVIVELQAILKSNASLNVRLAAAEGVVHASRGIKYPLERNAAIKWLKKHLMGRGVEDRMMLLDCADVALTVYSPELFEVLFADAVLVLSRDSSPVVRAKLAGILSRLCLFCQGHEEFEPALRLLRGDNDKLVRDAMSTFVARAGLCLQEGKKNKAALRRRRLAELQFFQPYGMAIPEAAGGEESRGALKGVGATLLRLGSKVSSFSWSLFSSGRGSSRV